MSLTPARTSPGRGWIRLGEVAESDHEQRGGRGRPGRVGWAPAHLAARALRRRIALWSTRVFSPPGWVSLPPGSSAEPCQCPEKVGPTFRAESRNPGRTGAWVGQDATLCFLGPRGRRSRTAFVVRCSHVGPAERVCRTRLVPLVLRHWDRPERFAGVVPRWRRLGLARSVVERKEQACRMSRQRSVSSTTRKSVYSASYLGNPATSVAGGRQNDAPGGHNGCGTRVICTLQGEP